MFLSGLQFANFRNFRSACFEFKAGANTIIGENDSGKSNAIAGLRMLFDDSFFYNVKRLKESDFSRTMTDWRGHWVIISATFDGITDEDKQSEICASLLVDEKELIDSVSNLISSDCRSQGVVTLLIRPQKSVRQKLFEASGNASLFNSVRQKIRLSDYEFYFTSKSKADFCSKDVYKSIVGDLDAFQAADPESDDEAVLGHRQSITDIQNHISLVYIDALRDVLRELHLPKNPIRRIIEAIEGKISEERISAVKSKIRELNEEITGIAEVGVIGNGLNKKLLDILGVVYSPELSLSSELSDEINSLSKFIAMRSKNEDDLDLLGLGHLNMIFLALKIVEFETCRSRELLNIMVVEEPETHIHSHIQKTLFENLSVTEGHTQVLMTTHSVHLAESSEISRMNIIKSHAGQSTAMRPFCDLDKFGHEGLKLNNSLSLTRCIERYLDAKRNVLLFSKGVMLVEGDAEEILVPNMIKEAYGISLDEIGIGLVNVGSTAFEYIASIFAQNRVQRFCSILTDLDNPSVAAGSNHYKAGAAQKGIERSNKLERLYGENPWVQSFFAAHTFEIEFVAAGENFEYVSRAIDSIYSQRATIESHKQKIKTIATRNEEMLELADVQGKGWFATILTDCLDCNVAIPDYIVEAVAFASQETMSLQIYAKILRHSIEGKREGEATYYLEKLTTTDDEALIKIISDILDDEHFSNDETVRLIICCENRRKLLC